MPPSDGGAGHDGGSPGRPEGGSIEADGGGDAPAVDGDGGPRTDAGVPDARGPVPAVGTPGKLELGSWNIEWFGASGTGPSDEARQAQNARDVLAGSQVDVWGVAEIADAQAFSNLLAVLPGYGGLLSDDPSVADGADFYRGGQQRLGIVYRTELASLLGARLVLTDQADAFGGRPPLEVTLRVALSGSARELVLVVLHAKAGDTAADWSKRRQASQALKSYLDGAHADDDVIVLGDFNDDVDTSIVAGSPSPYVNFLEDSAGYGFPSLELSLEDVSTTVNHHGTIDHHLTSGSLYGRYEPGSMLVYRVDEYIENYGESTSDHYPLVSRYDWRE